MKVITIGRDDSCDILLDDPNISRRHAVLRLHPTGRIEIIDYSRNGTSVNGVRLGSEKLTRVTRKDSITFAGVKSLDWSKIPDPSRPLRMAVIIGCVVVAIAVLAVVGISVYRSSVASGSGVTPPVNDTISNTVVTPPVEGEQSEEKVDTTGTAAGAEAVQGDLPSVNPNAPKVNGKGGKGGKGGKVTKTDPKANPKADPKADPKAPKADPKAGQDDNAGKENKDTRNGQQFRP